MNSIEYINALYDTLRTLKGREYKAEDYKWKLGAKVIYDIQPHEFTHKTANEKMTMFGIEVEIDYINPNKLQLFEDITNKVSIPYSDYKEVDDD